MGGNNLDKEFSFNKLLAACFILYGPLFHFSFEKLLSLNLTDLKSIFHSKAKLFHPDRAKISGKSEEYLQNRFKELNNAYSLLYEYIKTCSNKNFSYFRKVYNAQRNENSYSNKKGSDFFYSFEDRREDYSNNNHADNDSNNNDFYFTGKTPQRILRLGEFLYYSKKISWKTLIKALIYQYQRRPKLGELCLNLGFINNQEIFCIIKNLSRSEKFGECAVRLNYLTNYQLLVGLGMQKKYNYPIGKFFTDKSIFSYINLNEFITKQQEHNFNIKYKVY